MKAVRLLRLMYNYPFSEVKTIALHCMMFIQQNKGKPCVYKKKLKVQVEEEEKNKKINK